MKKIFVLLIIMNALSGCSSIVPEALYGKQREDKFSSVFDYKRVPIENTMLIHQKDNIKQEKSIDDVDVQKNKEMVHQDYTNHSRDDHNKGVVYLEDAVAMLEDDLLNIPDVRRRPIHNSDIMGEFSENIDLALYDYKDEVSYIASIDDNIQHTISSRDNKVIDDLKNESQHVIPSLSDIPKVPKKFKAKMKRVRYKPLNLLVSLR